MRHTRVTMRSLLAMLIVQSFLYQLLLWFAVLSSLFFWFVLQSISQFACCQLFCQILHLWWSMSQPAFIYHHSHSVWSLVTLGHPCIMSLLVAWVSRLGSLPRSQHGQTWVILADPVKLTLGKQSQTLSNYFCPIVVLAIMCLNDFLCPPRVLLSAGVKRSLTGTAINPFQILYRLVSLMFFLLVCKSVQA